MSRSNYDKPFYVDVGTSIAAVRCASDGDIVAMYDHVRSGHWAIEEAEIICDKLNSEAKLAAGNSADMRECLLGVKKIAMSYINAYDDEIDKVMSRIVSLCESALSAPPRNCDVGTADERKGENDGSR